MVPTTGFEPAAYSLRVNCSTVGAKLASLPNYYIAISKIIKQIFRILVSDDNISHITNK